MWLSTLKKCILHISVFLQTDWTVSDDVANENLFPWRRVADPYDSCSPRDAAVDMNDRRFSSKEIESIQKSLSLLVCDWFLEFWAFAPASLRFMKDIDSPDFESTSIRRTGKKANASMIFRYIMLTNKCSQQTSVPVIYSLFVASFCVIIFLLGMW